MRPLRIGQFVEYDCSRAGKTMARWMDYWTRHNGSIGIVMGPPRKRRSDKVWCYPIKWLVRMHSSPESPSDRLRDFDEDDFQEPPEPSAYPRYLLKRSKYIAR